MSGVSLPVTRPAGRALLVGSPTSRGQLAQTLGRLGYATTDLDDPYAAMAELCGKPAAYRAVIVSLASLYREELAIIGAIKGRYPHVEIWLAHTDGRQSALAEAMRLGADGLVDDQGLHRVAIPAQAPRLASELALTESEAEAQAAEPATGSEAEASGEPILTAEELRALLQEQPAAPPGHDAEH